MEVGSNVSCSSWLLWWWWLLLCRLPGVLLASVPFSSSLFCWSSTSNWKRHLMSWLQYRLSLASSFVRSFMEPCPLLMVTSFTNANSRTRFFTWESTYVKVASHSCSRLLVLAWLVDEVDDFFSYRAFSVHKYFGFSHFQFRQCRFPFPVHAGIQADKRAEGPPKITSACKQHY